MDRSSSLERRLSLNATPMSPIAESTSFNLNGSNAAAAAAAAAATHFRWGATPISPKQRDRSRSHAGSTTSDYANQSVASTTSLLRSKSSMTKIDPRIYADVRSRGLTSRIVRYHENGTRLNRSASVNNLYSKPGQFPLVHLQKTELPYKATKPSMSMTRIAPPEKSMFYGNTLSSLLRSNSVLGLQQSDEEISSENRPIIHPPPTENDLAPTRSVLEVLKEISRKRINSDEGEANEVTKRYCDHRSNDRVDMGSAQLQLQLRNQLPNSTLVTQNFKRQRTAHSQTNQADTHGPQSSTWTASNGHLNHTSPEQAKKRLCSYNNDITSSLSSSINKRKLYEQRVPSDLIRTRSADMEGQDKQKTKVQRHQCSAYSGLKSELLSSAIGAGDGQMPSPLPAAQSNLERKAAESGVSPRRSISESSNDAVQQKSAIVPTRSTKSRKGDKPRLTLFNKNYEDNNGGSTSNETSGAVDHVEQNECSSIQFVKPKKSSSISGVKNPLFERTQKSKLALMLCGLRGELYQGEAMDEVDTVNKSKDPDVFNSTTTTTTTTATTVTNSLKDTPPSTTTVTTRTSVTDPEAGNNNRNAIELAPPNASKVTSNLTSTTTSVVASTTVVPTAPSKTTTSPLVGLKLTPQKQMGPTGPSFGPQSTLTTATTSITSSTVPVLGGFAFGTTTTTKPSLNATPITTPSQAVFGSKTNQQAGPVAPISGIPKIDFSFGTPLAPISTTISTTSPSKGFSTGPNLSQAPETTSLTTTVSSGFSFGSPATLVTTASTAAKETTTVCSSGFSFGSPATFGTPASTAAKETASTGFLPPATTFTFGQSQAAAAIPSQSAVAFTCGSSATIPATSTTTVAAPLTTKSTTSVESNTKPTFAFGSGTVSSANPQPFAFKPLTTVAPQTTTTTTTIAPTLSSNVASGTTGTFSFGSGAIAQPKPSAVATPFSFGSTGTQTQATAATTAASNFVATTKSFSFGSVGANNTFSFGSAATPAPNPIGNASGSVFGGLATSSNPAATPFAFGAKTAAGNTAVSSTPSTAGGFSFGDSTAAKPNDTSGVIKPSFSFGGTANAAATSTEKPLFGNVLSKSALANTFNSSTENKTFTFGSNTQLAASQPTNLFGGVPVAATDKPGTAVGALNSGGFSFGAAGPNKPIAASTSTPSIFNFGAAGNSNSSAAMASSGGAGAPTSSASPFTFGTANASNTSASKLFSFGSNNSGSTFGGSNTGTSNIFGATTAPANAAAPVFNFNAGSSNMPSSVSLPPTAPAAGNIFAPPQNITTGPGDRPIRRATRRLQK